MKWFKHDSDASNDAKLKKLRLKYGAQGYGIYWYCLELIARNVEKHNLTFELEHDAELIADDFKLSAELVQHIMTYMVELELFENTDGIISCLKMATRTDEYTQKLLHSVKKHNDNVPTMSVEYLTKSELIEEKRAEENKINKREIAYIESNLPHSFEYKIRDYFLGKCCPICFSEMKQEIEDGIVTKNRIPTIQHNLPLSKGGKHEIENISVICKQCNLTIKDNQTGLLNNEEVKKAWSILNVSKLEPQVSIGKVSQGKKEAPIPDNFSVSERVIKWANEKGYRDLDKHLEHFVILAQAKGYTYTDWDAAFMNAIRNNWAKVASKEVKLAL